MSESSLEILRKLKRVSLLALDADGVLTDGGVYLSEDGKQFRRFDIKDGAGLNAVMALGIHVVIISSGSNLAVRHRCRELGIDALHLDVDDKLACLRQICAQRSLGLDQVCYVGDDLVDLPVLAAVGFSCAPADAIGEVKAGAVFVASKSGGHGAVREVCDAITGCRDR